MAGRRPPLGRNRQDEIRAKIKAGNLIARLEQHIDGKITLENSQIKAIEVLLDRSIPKLSAIELSNGGKGMFMVGLMSADGRL